MLRVLEEFVLLALPLRISSAYKKGFLDAITATLRQRDYLPVDEKMVQAQLETQKFLILFDGVSGISVNKQEAIKEIFEFACNADYKNCRFVLSTRPSINLPEDFPIFELEPLTIDLMEKLLSEYLSKREQFDFARNQLASFSEKPIEPLLFTMIVDHSDKGYISRTKATLFERYFRYLLGVKDQDAWDGWCFLLGIFAEWSMINTGIRGLGLDHEEFIQKIRNWRENDFTLLSKIDIVYGLKFESEREMLNVLDNLILNKEGGYWYFFHDSYEDFFAASRLIYVLRRQKSWLYLSSWHSDIEQEKAFLGVIEFVDEIIFEMGSHGKMYRERILKEEISELWKSQLSYKKQTSHVHI